MTTAHTPVDTGRSRAQPVLAALFVLYLGPLVWTVLWKLEVPWVGVGTDRAVKLVPFVATARAGPSAPGEVVVNALLFVPFGVYLGLLAPAWRWWRAAGLIAAASLALEVAQYVLAVGRSDVTDVLVNAVGGLAGLAVVAAARRVLGGRTQPVLTRVCAAATAFALLAGAFVVVGPLRFGPPHGRVLHRSVPADPRSTSPASAPAPPPVAHHDQGVGAPERR